MSSRLPDFAAAAGLPPLFKTGGTGGTGGFGETLADLTSYPILTEEVGYPPSPLATPSGGSGSAPSGQSQLGQMAMKAVSDVLGWRARSDDPKGFVGALTQAFTLREVAGQVISTWTPRTYAVQTDLSGGITGAQASLYNRAKVALDAALPILDGLYALDPEADPEFVTALREVARNQMQELVNELGYAGGPRISRINQYFSLLLATPIQLTRNSTIVTEPDIIDPACTLGNLRDVYGLATRTNGALNPFVNTLEDEQDATNFRVLCDYFTSLAQSWVNNFDFFGLDVSTPFFGTQLVLISRQLSVSSELVDETRFALDSVFIGPADRQTLEIQFRPIGGAPPDPSIFLEDLLCWTQRFAVEEGPALIQSAGKFGASQVRAVVDTLRRLVRGAVNPKNTVPPGYRAPRVQRALLGLADQLDELSALVTQVQLTKLATAP